MYCSIDAIIFLLIQRQYVVLFSTKWLMNKLFISGSTGAIRTLALNFYASIVDSAFTPINYHRTEPRKFIIAKLSIRKLGSSSVLIIMTIIMMMIIIIMFLLGYSPCKHTSNLS